MTVTQTQGGNQQSTSAGKLPILVGILAILVGLFGLFLAVVGILAIFNSLGALEYPGLVPFSAYGGTTIAAGMLTLIFGAILLFVAMGLWALETWALWLTGIVTAGVIVVLLWSASFGVALAIAVVLLIYLIAVRKHFY
jgi:lysylphosphatidylglycerol synthetase-like protein (DUF2156 family)